MKASHYLISILHYLWVSQSNSSPLRKSVLFVLCVQRIRLNQGAWLIRLRNHHTIKNQTSLINTKMYYLNLSSIFCKQIRKAQRGQIKAKQALKLVTNKLLYYYFQVIKISKISRDILVKKQMFLSRLIGLYFISFNKQVQIRMKVRELVEFLVFPKSFNVLSFYSKGHYAIRIRLTAQNLGSGKPTKALPVLVQGRQARRQQGKKANINLQEFYYETQHFYVTFSQQKILFNTACIFKLEFEMNEKYSVYLDFDLVHSAYKKTINEDGVSETARKVRSVEHRRIYINSYTSVNTFKRVLFDDCDYFSLTDVYLLSQPMGEKIRIHNYQLSDFHLQSLQTRKFMHHEAFQQQMMLGRQKNAQLKRNFQMSIEQFYVKMIGEKIMRYRKLCQTYQKFKFHMASLNSSSVAQKKSIDQLQWIRMDEYRRESQLMDMYQTENISELFMLIYQQSHLIVKNTKYIWNQMADLLLTINFNVMEQLAAIDIDNQQKTKALWLVTYSNITIQQRQERRQHFLKKREEIIQTLNVYEDMDLYHPFLTVQNYYPNDSIMNLGGEVDSLVIFVHGYQGSSIDLEKARNFMNIYSPNSHGLLIKTIQDEIDEPIQKLGQMIAQQVRLHMINTLNQYKRINFVGYSLGGILARQSLHHLYRYRDRMNIFITLASPHAGIRDTQNPLVKTGIWWLTNFQKNKNLKQLNCECNPQNQLITLYTLSQCDAISWFKKFVAVSSREDNFVPYLSSRIEQGDLKDIPRQICINLKERIRRLERVEVWFDVQHNVGTLDKITGRRAHIQFLQNRVFLDCFFSIYAPLF